MSYNMPSHGSFVWIPEHGISQECKAKDDNVVSVDTESVEWIDTLLSDNICHKSTSTGVKWDKLVDVVLGGDNSDGNDMIRYSLSSLWRNIG